jgi:uncharacterized membrane protein
MSNVSRLGEPDAHTMMRWAKKMIRICLIVASISTIGLLFFFRPAAYLAAIPIPFLVLIFAVVSHLERQSRVTALRRPEQTGITEEEVEVDAQAAGVSTVLGIVFLLALGTFIIAASMFDWVLVGAAAAAAFLLAVLINIPYLSLFAEEAALDERDKVTSSSSRGGDPK